MQRRLFASKRNEAHRATAVFVLLAPVVVASGAVERQGASPGSDASSARFFQVSANPAEEGEKSVSTFAVIEGAFDWRDQTGWAVQRYANASIFWRRVNGACLEWSDESAEGSGSEPMKIEDNCGLPAIANDPRTTFAFMRQRAGVEKIGTEVLDGVYTTRYRVTWSSEKRVPVELWVDKADVARRLHFGGEATGLTINYFDFGVDAAAEWRSPNEPPRWAPDQNAEDVSN